MFVAEKQNNEVMLNFVVVTEILDFHNAGIRRNIYSFCHGQFIIVVAVTWPRDMSDCTLNTDSIGGF